MHSNVHSGTIYINKDTDTIWGSIDGNKDTHTHTHPETHMNIAQTEWNEEWNLALFNNMDRSRRYYVYCNKLYR